MKRTSFSLQLGALAPSITSQLTDQGLSIKASEAILWQRLDHAITLLKVHGLLTDAQASAARKKMLKGIGKAVFPSAGRET